MESISELYCAKQAPMAQRAKTIVGAVGWVFVGLGLALLAFGAWAIAPFSLKPFYVIRTAELVLKAPFTERMVIGDSRVSFAEAPSGSLFAGYGGATSRDLERVSGILCTLSNAQVTIALGINDTKPWEHDEAGSRRAFGKIVANCQRDHLWLSAIWPAEASMPPGGKAYDPVMTATLNAHLEALAQRAGARFMSAPQMQPNYTYDGVHFTEPVSHDYARRLAYPEQVLASP
ncbi:SGNH/GDSL hydrolase family protein [Qipengyuania sp. G39]|uniref:SGNH/GDSL hydrolase family protein n=1 Tax=Qipengyuania profundimaris TaxID=3067652 RepID=A0ABT9HSK3_9SPHN|nr:SGNH/GDSL hydrolase family protein [Qipengyuania sp. G39]MDP4575807.1 SGNH/GDSL hydrolase family protein [Qipengyuania sp. G39]